MDRGLAKIEGGGSPGEKSDGGCRFHQHGTLERDKADAVDGRVSHSPTLGLHTKFVTTSTFSGHS